MNADLSRARWRTGSYSGANGDCVEVAPSPHMSPSAAARTPGTLC